MNLRGAKNNSGMALVVVMISITVLSLMAAGFAYMMKVETKLAQNADSEEELLWLGRSGMEYARYVLSQQLTLINEPYDSLNQVWAGGPGSATNDSLANIQLKDYKLGNGKFSLTIVDLERKVNINIVDDVVLEQALKVMNVDAGDAPAITSSILDWIDRDDDPRLSGAESSYYQGLNPPYFPKNGPIDDLSELLLVKGVTAEMYWGPSSAEHPPAYFQGSFGHASLNDAPPAYTCGLVDMFTPLSTGKININTASETTLQVIPSIDANLAADIIRQRSGPDGIDGTEDDTPFQNVGELINVGVSAQAIPQISKYCDVRSHTFEVIVDAQVGSYKRKFHAVLGRSSAKDIQVLSFYWD